MGRLWPLSLLLCVCACTSPTVFDKKFNRDRAAAPFFFLQNQVPTAGEQLLADESAVYRPMQDLNLAQQHDRDVGERPALAAAMPAGCSISDRFDRKGVLAWNFSDNQSRLSLNMKIDGIGFTGAEVEQVMLKFTYKFQPLKNRKERCRYPSGFQGLIGSGYNEFFLRQRDTVWDELRDKNPLGLFD